MILEIDEYTKLLNGSKNDSDMAVCLLKFLMNVVNQYESSIVLELEKQMTKAGYSVKYNFLNGVVIFGKGYKEILISDKYEVTNA